MRAGAGARRTRARPSAPRLHPARIADRELCRAALAARAGRAVRGSAGGGVVDRAGRGDGATERGGGSQCFGAAGVRRFEILGLAAAAAPQELDLPCPDLDGAVLDLVPAGVRDLMEGAGDQQLVAGLDAGEGLRELAEGHDVVPFGDRLAVLESLVDGDAEVAVGGVVGGLDLGLVADVAYQDRESHLTISFRVSDVLRPGRGHRKPERRLPQGVLSAGEGAVASSRAGNGWRRRVESSLFLTSRGAGRWRRDRCCSARRGLWRAKATRVLAGGAEA